MVRKLIIGAGLAAMAATAIAAAPGGMGGKDLTRDEMVAKVRDHFAQMDTNKDGVLVADELKGMREMRMAKRHGDKSHDRMMHRDPNEMFGKLDTNNDGSISRDEFVKGHEMRVEKRTERREAMKGGKGDRSMRSHHGAAGMHMIGMADADKDGRVTLAEAQALALRHFDQMDANRDGKVTADERKAAWSAMKGKRDQRMEEHAPTAG